MANKSHIQFRVHEVEQKPNFASVVRGVNYDTKFYLNDKDSPAEDTVATNWVADPSKLFTGCSVFGNGVAYIIPWKYQSATYSSNGVLTDISSTGIVPQNTRVAADQSITYGWIALFGNPVQFNGLNLNMLISYAAPTALIDYAPIATYNPFRPLFSSSSTTALGQFDTNLIDTTRYFLSGNTGNYWRMHQSGSWNWTNCSKATWVKGLTTAYTANVTNHATFTPMRQVAQIPNHMNYYWAFAANNMWDYGNSTNPTTAAQYRGASAAFTMMP